MCELGCSNGNIEIFEVMTPDGIKKILSYRAWLKKGKPDYKKHYVDRCKCYYDWLSERLLLLEDLAKAKRNKDLKEISKIEEKLNENWKKL